MITEKLTREVVAPYLPIPRAAIPVWSVAFQAVCLVGFLCMGTVAAFRVATSPSPTPIIMCAAMLVGACLSIFLHVDTIRGMLRKVPECGGKLPKWFFQYYGRNRVGYDLWIQREGRDAYLYHIVPSDIGRDAILDLTCAVRIPLRQGARCEIYRRGNIQFWRAENHDITFFVNKGTTNVTLRVEDPDGTVVRMNAEDLLEILAPTDNRYYPCGPDKSTDLSGHLRHLAIHFCLLTAELKRERVERDLAVRQLHEAAEHIRATTRFARSQDGRVIREGLEKACADHERYRTVPLPGQIDS